MKLAWFVFPENVYSFLPIPSWRFCQKRLRQYLDKNNENYPKSLLFVHVYKSACLRYLFEIYAFITKRAVKMAKCWPKFVSLENTRCATTFPSLDIFTAAIVRVLRCRDGAFFMIGLLGHREFVFVEFH